MRLLLILPLGFYGFGKTLSKALEDRGYDVIMENDEFPVNIVGKLLGKLGGLSILRYFTLRRYVQRYGAFKKTFDVVLIIKGRGVGVELVEFLRKISRHIVAYNFDSFEFNPSPLTWMRSVDEYSTFDIKDASQYKVSLVHLFSAISEFSGASSKSIDVSVLMKNHSQRLIYIDKILSELSGDLSKFIYIYEPYWLSAFLGVLKNPILYFKYFKFIHFKPMPYDGFVDVLRKSKITIDYAHPSQTGITIRCFEAASLGTSIITNNDYVFEHPFFHSRSVAVIPLNSDVSKYKNAINNLLHSPVERGNRDVNDFLDEILVGA